jgi:hypothetical protein
MTRLPFVLSVIFLLLLLSATSAIDAKEIISTDVLWNQIFRRLDAADRAIWTASAKITRHSPYHNDGHLYIYAAEIADVLIPEELAELGVEEPPYTIVLLRFENETNHEVWVYGTKPDCYTLVDTYGNAYSALNLFEEDMFHEVAPIVNPFRVLAWSYRICFDDLVPGARAYMTLLFPKVEEIKQLNISDRSIARYDAILKFQEGSK